MIVSFSTLFQLLGDFLWNVLRIGAFMMVVPVFGNRLITGRVRVALCIAIAAALTPVAPVGVDLAEAGLNLLGDLAVHMLFAVGLGFAATLFFQLYVIAGQFIGMQMGLGFAAMVDPGNGLQVTVWSQFFLMLVTMAFLSVEGHLLLLEILIQGFALHPPGSARSLAEYSLHIAQMGGWMFIGGVLVAIPAVVSLLIVNLAFGIMNRSAPQLNVFALGFPFSLLFGIVVIWVLMFGFGDQFLRIANELYQHLFTLQGY